MRTALPVSSADEIHRRANDQSNPKVALRSLARRYLGERLRSLRWLRVIRCSSRRTAVSAPGILAISNGLEAVRPEQPRRWGNVRFTGVVLTISMMNGSTGGGASFRENPCRTAASPAESAQSVGRHSSDPGLVDEEVPMARDALTSS